MEGAPGLYVPSRIIYREALELIERGDWQEAKGRLLLSASLSGDYPDPLFTLAKNEFLHFDADFLPHLIEGFSRLTLDFYVQSFVIANTVLIVTAVAIGTLVIVLMLLLAKYWPLIEHTIHERCSAKFSFPPANWIGLILLIAFVSLRAGIALYISMLMLFVWTSMRVKEKVVVLGLVFIVSTLSFFAHYSNVLVPPMDPGSATRRLSLVNERGADDELFQLINGIGETAFRAERDYALGTLLYRLEILPEARDFLLNSISENREFAPAYSNLGNVYFKQGDYDKALAGYQNAISVDAENALAHYNLGQTYIKMMLFAQSSTALKRASELDIDAYQMTHPATTFRDLTIYEEGFTARTLWGLAFREARERERIFLTEILQPFLLFPFHRLWILLLATALVSIVIGLKAPQSNRVFRCDNCDQPTCPSCADDELGIRLCRDCAGVVEGLSSVKVMEALLRHRRQKILKRISKRITWRKFVIPGAAHIRFGKTFAGAFYISVSIISIMSLVWRGFYFKEPTVLIDSVPLWKTLVPVACLLYCIAASLTKKPAQESRPYWILPSELREVEKKQTQRKAAAPAEAYPWETVDVT